MFVAWFTVAVLRFTAEFDFFKRLRRGMLHHFEFCSRGNRSSGFDILPSLKGGDSYRLTR
jgi:hypothetical protein